MNNWKFWALSLAIIAAVAFLFLPSKKRPEPLTHQPLALEVQTAPTQPVTTRIGVNLKHGFPDHDQVRNLMRFRPAWLRNQSNASVAEFLELSRSLQANPWLIVSANLTDEELKALGQLLAEKSNHFSQIILELEKTDDRSYTLIAAAAGPQVNLRKIIQNSELNLSEGSAHALLKDLYLNDSPQLINSDAKLAPAAIILNEVIGGSLHEVAGESQNLTTAAFRTHNTWAAAVVSKNSKPWEVTLTFPNDGRTLPTFALVLNESEIIKEPIRTEGRMIHVTIPAQGVIVLTSDALTEHVAMPQE